LKNCHLILHLDHIRLYSVRTLRQLTELAKPIIHHPMQRHLKCRLQMLRHKRLNEAIDTGTYFSSENSIEGYHCAQFFFEMNSKILHVAGMNTESEFPDIFIDFIREHGIPSVKSEIGQLVRQIHTESDIPWKNLAELNGIKYLKSYVQV
jgi:hypothetical protein